MQPEIPQAPLNGAEQMPLPPNVNGEQVPTLPPLETGMERSAERQEQMAEAGAAASDMATAAPVANPVAPVVPPVAAPTSTPTAVSGPVTAADEDLIEKEWVDKAKSIVQNTVDDPHARTSQVSQLRLDYREKRHGDADAGAVLRAGG